MNDLTKMEEAVLVAVWRLKGQAYGYAIRKCMAERLRQEISLGNLYSVLYQMHRKGYIHKTVGEATPSRGGKEKIFYAIRPSGIEALRRARETAELLRRAIPRHALLVKNESD